jgi:hypothetical protein
MNALNYTKQQTLPLRSDLQTGGNLLWGSSLVIVLALIPVYIFSSGGFQLVDIPLFLIIIGTFFVRKNEKDSYIRKYIFYYTPFVFWAILVSVTYFSFLSNWGFLIGVIPVVYAIFLMNTFYMIFTRLIRQKDIKYIYVGLIISVILCFTVKGYSEETRAVLSFNDPNQLGYFAIFLLAYVILLINYKEKYNANKKIYSFMDIFIMFIAHYFLLLSVSRSAIAAFLILDACLLKKLLNFRQIFRISFAILVMTGYVFLVRPTFIQERIAGRQEHFASETMAEQLESRLFLPFENFGGLHILVGKGTGYRKGDIFMEVHNLFGEVFRAFGLIGLSLLIFFLVNLGIGVMNVKDSFWLLAGILTFNMGIYGIRWRGFWIFIAFLMSLAGLVNSQKTEKTI